MTNLKPKRGDKFIHARKLYPDAKPPYDESSHLVCVVTNVRNYPAEVVVYFTLREAWDRGDHQGAWTFKLANAGDAVLRWL